MPTCEAGGLAVPGRFSSRGFQWKPLIFLAAVAGLGCIGIIASVAEGPVDLSADEVIEALGARSETPAGRIVWNLRLPRALLGVLVGVNLAVSGCILQGVMRNPLAAPEIIGVTSGAGLAATLVMVLSAGTPSALPLAAFAGAVLSSLLVYGISWQPGVGTSPLRMTLAGIAVSSMLAAFTTFLMVTFSSRVQPVILWMSGSLVGRSWNHVEMILPYSLLGLVAAGALARPLNLLRLGDDSARGLGVRVELVRCFGLATACLLAASGVSVSGLIGFVGLMVPHIMRLVAGSNHGWLIPASAAGGGLLLLYADLVARMLAELPVGILTAMIGGPYFVYLLYRRTYV